MGKRGKVFLPLQPAARSYASPFFKPSYGRHHPTGGKVPPPSPRRVVAGIV
ncbi:hypothetical protein AGMMS50268_37520 [Spirochaetia bacterium]|nr:hypothetical protein AGMMS50268_37520 [Spirochaetia bacterium]